MAPRRAARNQAKRKGSTSKSKRQTRLPKSKHGKRLSGRGIQSKPEIHTTRIDPFQRLPDTAIEIIIFHLPNLMTETLRRVSRTWQYYSEYFNANTAIARRFPHTVVPVLPSRDFANLVFRRLLHIQGSAGTNLVQSERMISDVIAWDIRNECLAYGCSDGSIYIEDRSQVIYRQRHLVSFKNHAIVGLDGLWILDQGAVLVRIYDKAHPHSAALCRLWGPPGAVHWAQAVSRASIAENGGGKQCLYQRSLAVGRGDVFYSIEESSRLPQITREQPRRYRRLIVARSLTRGDIIMRAPLSETLDSLEGHLELYSVNDGSLLIVKGLARVIHVCSSADLQPIRGMLDDRVHHWLDHPESRDKSDQSVWRTEVFPIAETQSWIEKSSKSDPQGLQKIRLTKATWTAWTNEISRCEIDERCHGVGRSIGDSSWALRWGMDFNQGFLFTFQPFEDNYQGVERVHWNGSRGWLQMERFSIIDNTRLRGRDCLSLHRGVRRTLELPARACDHYKAHQKVLFEDIDDPLVCIGIMKECLVYFTPLSRRLTLLNFRVSW